MSFIEGSDFQQKIEDTKKRRIVKNTMNAEYFRKLNSEAEIRENIAVKKEYDELLTRMKSHVETSKEIISMFACSEISAKVRELLIQDGFTVKSRQSGINESEWVVSW